MRDAQLQAGAAAMDITPPMKVTLAGYLQRRYAEGVVDHLYAKAIVVGNNETKLAFVLLDLIAFIHEDCDDVRRSIAEALNIPIANVCVSCTHTHFAPGVKDGFETPREAEYIEWAKPRMIQAAVQAAQNMVPAQAAWGTGNEARPQYNRRYHMRDGSVRFNPRDKPNIMKVAGPTDPSLPLLLLRRADNQQMIAILANYSLHYVGDHPSGKICADYFGEFTRLAKERFGENCLALLTHGASGDINNSNHQKLPEPWYPTEMKLREKSQIIAGMLLDQVQHIWQDTEWHDVAKLCATQDIYEMKVRKISGSEIDRAKREENDESLSIVVRHFATERLALLNFPDTLPQVVSSLRVGDWAASTLTGEIFCQFGLDLKNASPFPVTALIELANGYGGYTPTRYSYELGAYETWLDRSAFAAPGTGEEEIAIAARQLRRIWLENNEEKIEVAQEKSLHPNW